jgi:DNA-binding GntR family transcriptional regulator
MSKASDRAYAQIKAMILSGALPPAAPLREEQLAEACGVSRTPVREAIRRLEAELFVQKTETQRYYVADASPDDIADAFALRAMLESHAARRAAQRITAQEVALLREHNGAIQRAVEMFTPDIPAFLDHNRRFHAIILAAAASARLTSMLAQIVEQPVVLRTAMHYDRESLRRAYREHDELLAAFERRDADWAAAVMTGHIHRAFHAYADARAAAQHQGGVRAA